MEDALRAIANPRRRAMLELVWDRERLGRLRDAAELEEHGT